MTLKTRSGCTLASLYLLSACAIAPIAQAEVVSGDSIAREHGHGDHLGTVNLATSCNADASAHLQRGLALLHHMMYDGAERAFIAATKAQPDCAMGYWGQAMSFVHPIWSDPPDAMRFEKGRSLVKEAQRRGTKTSRERAYIRALQAYYEVEKTNKETANLQAFARGWESVREQYPDDPEATLFSALGQLATADPSDKTFAQQERAGQLIEKLFARYPEHPGAHHYIIHAYDYPPLAGRALQVARDYGKIAPEVPHALHMPTHIFMRLGLWEESIAWNERSAQAALNNPVKGSVSLHYLHALDYLAYAHLQRGQDGKALGVHEKLRQLRKPVQIQLASAYAFAAVPARIALERQRWKEASALDARAPSWYPWDTVPAVEALTHFARALGAARSGNSSLARDALDRLAVLRDQAAASNSYWGTQVEIQRLAALAWLTYEEGQRDRALETMRQAAGLEAGTEKHPVTPSEILPARELLADMLLELGEHAAAQEEYGIALERSPNRLNSVYGSGRAAELRGDELTAKMFYKQLVDLTADADTASGRVEHARSFLSSLQMAHPR
jgi:tetratricopeptide (TPR) repeat protein